MLTTREDMAALLKQYPEWKKKTALLEFERKNPARESSSEVISGLALAHPLCEGPGVSGHISDKTMRIAMSFREETDRLNLTAILEIDQELGLLESRAEKLEFFVSQLEAKQAEVIRGHYFEGKTWPVLQQELHISSRTLSKRRDSGLDALIAMGKYLEEVTKEPVNM